MATESLVAVRKPSCKGNHAWTDATQLKEHGTQICLKFKDGCCAMDLSNLCLASKFFREQILALFKHYSSEHGRHTRMKESPPVFHFPEKSKEVFLSTYRKYLHEFLQYANNEEKAYANYFELGK